MTLHEIIHSDPEVLHGTPVFTGTRVPVQSLFWHLEDGVSINDFLEDFPTVTKQQCEAVIELAAKAFGSQKFLQFYESAA
jgi:uncharacterized protein (DUF433 family)